jgi:hypothetical protein
MAIHMKKYLTDVKVRVKVNNGCKLTCPGHPSVALA